MPQKFNYKALRKIRRDSPKKVTQEDMANLLGVTRTTYSKKERGELPVSMDELKVIANFFNKDVGAYFTFTSEPKRKQDTNLEEITLPNDLPTEKPPMSSMSDINELIIDLNHMLVDLHRQLAQKDREIYELKRRLNALSSKKGDL